MDLEKDQLRKYFSHPLVMNVTSTTSFKFVNLTVDAMKIPLPDNINLHMQTGQLIFNDLNKTTSSPAKAKNILRK